MSIFKMPYMFPKKIPIPGYWRQQCAAPVQEESLQRAGQIQGPSASYLPYLVWNKINKKLKIF